MRIHLGVVEPVDDIEEQETETVAVAIVTLSIQVFSASDADSPEGKPLADAMTAETEDEPVYTGKVTLRVSADAANGEESEWVIQLFEAVWPYLRTHTVDHALRLGLGRIPVPLKAPDNLTRSTR